MLFHGSVSWEHLAGGSASIHCSMNTDWQNFLRGKLGITSWLPLKPVVLLKAPEEKLHFTEPGASFFIHHSACFLKLFRHLQLRGNVDALLLVAARALLVWEMLASLSGFGSHTRSARLSFKVFSSCFILSIALGKTSCVPSLLELTTSSEASDSSENCDLLNPHVLCVWELFYWRVVENLLEIMRSIQQEFQLCSGNSQWGRACPWRWSRPSQSPRRPPHP